jgi:hypothetical protein
LTVAAVYGQLAAALLIGVSVTYLPWRWSRLAGLLIVPVALFSLAPVLHGVLGAPSFTLAQLALMRFLRPDWPQSPSRLLARLLVGIGVIFYPLSLGYGSFDPFDLGYRPLPLLPVIMVLGLWLVWRREEAFLIVMGFDLLAYAGGLFNNLWNACFDPVLVILAIPYTLQRFRRQGVTES